ncbi:uncharacterized protein EI90DRAFT_779321 [Cantharellus anzutake]|uniref:uncharacterized protein n=1 Tax=Cantharellus anzutake TaxID=1750568 RepID=UPI001905946B|nr:uncharacterized protein EI90DRAFT_779321 [Cantharellus anzutake]KAF8342733.1 hypothetical protein EI90DRAFT_779321 [Cantharellus anzutake]
MEILAEPLPYRHPGHVESAAGTYSAMAEGDDADLTSPKLFDASKDDRLIRIHWQTLRSVRVRPERAVGPEPNGPSLHTFDRSFDLFVPLRVFRDFDGPTRKFSLLTPDVAPDQRFDVHPFDNLIVLQDTLNKTYEWEAWGPENTRFVELPLSERNVFQRHIYGNRYARICPETNGFIMLDFTPYRAEWERRRCASAGSHGFVAERREMIREKRDNIVKQGVHLAADVRTSLPYTYSRRSFGFEVPDDLFGRGVMIDDEHVLCIKVGCTFCLGRYQ